MSNPFLDRVNYVPDELPAPVAMAPAPAVSAMPWRRLIIVVLLIAASLTFSL